MTNNVTLNTIFSSIESNGGEIFVVGGSIRDKILGIDPKDIDFLVRKLTLEQIALIIKNIGKAGEVGQSFGIVKGIVDGQEFDFAMPRTEEIKNGDGHSDFSVKNDKNASVESDLSRRDFRFNAMALPLKDFISNDLSKIIDPHNGLQDLKDGVINAVGDPNSRFSEDPLRIMRSVMFATRMGFNITGETKEAIKILAPKLKSVSGERIFEELKKAWTKGKANSSILVELLNTTGVGKTLFGEAFKPHAVTLDLKGEDKIIGMFVAFFLEGGDFNIMKPDVMCIKMLELAKNIHSSLKPPHNYIGSLKEQLPILLEVFRKIGNNQIVDKIQSMMELPITAKELAIKGEEIITVLNIVNAKDNRKIGIAQKAMLDAIWNGELKNEKHALVAFCQALP